MGLSAKAPVVWAGAISGRRSPHVDEPVGAREKARKHKLNTLANLI